MSRLKSGSMLLADRGYDADWIRALAARKGALASIPPQMQSHRADCFSPYLYRARNLVERFFNKIKHCRRVATRYDKLAANYLAFVQLASIRLWLRVNERVLDNRASAWNQSIRVTALTTKNYFEAVNVSASCEVEFAKTLRAAITHVFVDVLAAAFVNPN